MVRSARPSWKVPINEFMIKTPKITIASGRSPITKAMIAAASRR